MGEQRGSEKGQKRQSTKGATQADSTGNLEPTQNSRLSLSHGRGEKSRVFKHQLLSVTV